MDKNIFKNQDPNLILVVKDGNKKLAQALINGGADVNAQDQRGKKTALMWAATQGHVEIVEALIGARANINAKDEWGQTALMCAATQGHVEIVEALIKAGADVEPRDKCYKNALMYAVDYGHVEIVEALIKAGANVNLGSWGTTPLITAIQGHKEIFQALIDAGADANLGSRGTTPLMRAAAEGYKEIVQALIDTGANINEQDNNGATALTCAARMGHTAIVRLFLNAGASSHSLGFVDRVYYSLSIAQASLLQFGRYIGRKLGLLTDPEQELCSAIKGGDLAKVKRLIDTGSINVNHLPQENMSALEFAINEAAKASATVVSAGPSSNPQDYEGIIREISQKSARWVVIKAINDCPEGSNRHKYISALRKDVSENPSNLDITTPPKTLLSSQNAVERPHNQNKNNTRPTGRN